MDGATRLAASTCRGVAWRSGLLAQTGLVCIRLTAVIITIVTLTALCETKISLYLCTNFYSDMHCVICVLMTRPSSSKELIHFY